MILQDASHQEDGMFVSDQGEDVDIVVDGRTFLRIVARILPRSSSRSLVFRFVAHCASVFARACSVLLFTCLHTYTSYK